MEYTLEKQIDNSRVLLIDGATGTEVQKELDQLMVKDPTIAKRRSSELHGFSCLRKY